LGTALVFGWLWQGIGAKIDPWKKVPAAQTLRVIGPTSGMSSVHVIQVKVLTNEGISSLALSQRFFSTEGGNDGQQ
jgi:hypothetical protein